jgi:hypothetical protein
MATNKELVDSIKFFIGTLEVLLENANAMDETESVINDDLKSIDNTLDDIVDYVKSELC